MADKAKFVGDLRTAISTVIDDGNRVNALIQFQQAMGWTQDDFAELLVNQDVNAAELFEAIEAWNETVASASSAAARLLKLKP